MGDRTRYQGSSRRGFLKGVGAAGAGLIAGSIRTGAGPVATAAAATPPALSPNDYARTSGARALRVDFGRIFPSLPPFAEANDTVRQAMLEVGMPGGILDAGDDLAAGPKALIVDPTVDGNPTPASPYGSNPDNPTMTAGSTFVGQFIDHTSGTGDSTSPTASPFFALVFDATDPARSSPARSA